MAQKKLRPFQVIAEIGKVETRSKGLRLTINTNEVIPDEASLLMSYREQQGWLLFMPAEGTAGFEQKDIDQLPDIQLDTGEKSPSQRLRGVLYRLWEQSKSRAQGQTFELFYRSYMERLIESIKEKLP